MKTKQWRGKLLAGAGALALAGGSVFAVAQAQTPGSGTQTPSPTPGAGRAAQAQERVDDWLNRLAGNLGVTPDRLRDALKQTAIQQVDEALAAGRLTPEQAQRAKDAITSGERLPFGGFGGPGGHHRGGPGGGIGGFRIQADDGLAQFLGITPEQLRTERREGKSLAEIAQAHGKSRGDLKQFLTDSMSVRLSSAVQSGRIAQAAADQMLQRFSENLDRMIDAKPGDRPNGGVGPGRMGPGGFGPGGRGRGMN